MSGQDTSNPAAYRKQCRRVLSTKLASMTHNPAKYCLQFPRVLFAISTSIACMAREPYKCFSRATPVWNRSRTSVEAAVCRKRKKGQNILLFIFILVNFEPKTLWLYSLLTLCLPLEVEKWSLFTINYILNLIFFVGNFFFFPIHFYCHI